MLPSVPGQLKGSIIIDIPSFERPHIREEVTLQIILGSWL